MPYDPVDPSTLEGDVLDRWYRRTPDEIEQERQAAAERQYYDFFGPSRVAGFSVIPDAGAESDATSYPAEPRPIGLGNASGDAEGLLTLVGNPANPRLRREWEKQEGRPWPKDERGRNYHVAHIKALADGGTNTLSNIRPMHPDEHIAEHVRNGDLARWAKRWSIARAFGGRVQELVGPIGILSDITGVLSGRIRTDTPDNFWHDLFGLPSTQDQRDAYERYQKALNPKWKWGDPDGV